LEAVVPAGFYEAGCTLDEGKPRDWEPLLRFLEDDWIFFASGYMKADLIQNLKRAELPSEVQKRLRQVVLNVVDRRDGREFRYYCKLARKVDSPELRDALRARLSHPDPAVRRRAGWALYACEQRNERGGDSGSWAKGDTMGRGHS
jgi:HEAT repeat protein